MKWGLDCTIESRLQTDNCTALQGNDLRPVLMSEPRVNPVSSSALDSVTLSPLSVFRPNCPPRERQLVLLQAEGEEDSLHHPPSGQVAGLLLDGAVPGWPQHAVCRHSALQPARLAHLCPM